MEILSDAVFHGSVEFKTKTTLPNGYVGAGNLAERSEFIITDNSIKVGQVGASYVFSRGQITTGCDSIVIGTFSGSYDNYSPIGENQFNNKRTITFPSSAGTLALTSQIPSLSGYLTTSAASSTYLSKTDASSTYLSKTTASSTYLSKTDASTTYQKKFTTFSSPSIPANCTAFEFTGTAISDSNKTHLIQVQNTSTGRSVIAETWMTANKKPAMSFAGCTSTVAAGTYTAIVL